MDYKPRHNQPFTLSEAINLDVSTITEEISRLRYSLKRLRETQELLHETTQGSDSTEPADAEIVQAYEENKVVIGSQEERIGILKLALTEKVVSVGTHYDLESSSGPSSSATPSTSTDTAANAEIVPADSDANTGGLYL